MKLRNFLSTAVGVRSAGTTQKLRGLTYLDVVLRPGAKKQRIFLSAPRGCVFVGTVRRSCWAECRRRRGKQPQTLHGPNYAVTRLFITELVLLAAVAF